MILTVYKPRVMIIGESLEYSKFYANEIVLKEENIVINRFDKIETQDVIYYIKSARNLNYIRGYRNFKEIKIYGNLKYDIWREIERHIMPTVRFDKSRIKRVRI